MEKGKPAGGGRGWKMVGVNDLSGKDFASASLELELRHLCFQ